MVASVLTVACGGGGLPNGELPEHGCARLQCRFRNLVSAGPPPRVEAPGAEVPGAYTGKAGLLGARARLEPDAPT